MVGWVTGQSSLTVPGPTPERRDDGMGWSHGDPLSELRSGTGYLSLDPFQDLFPKCRPQVTRVFSPSPHPRPHSRGRLGT